jgi:hypothetical protein
MYACTALCTGYIARGHPGDAKEIEMRYSGLAVLAQGLTGNKGWRPGLARSGAQGRL